MKIHRGMHRWAVIVGPWVVKIPRRVMEIPRRRQIKWFRKDLLPLKSLFVQLFDAPLENIREVYCYYSTHHRLLVPVWLPLIIFNVYPRVMGVGTIPNSQDEEVVYFFLKNYFTRYYPEALKTLPTHMWNPDNLSFYKGRVKIIDYGEEGVRELLVGWGDELEAQLFLFAHSPHLTSGRAIVWCHTSN